jgi:two-component system nitrate/nitrite sensor histidine kinase NarX
MPRPDIAPAASAAPAGSAILAHLASDLAENLASGRELHQLLDRFLAPIMQVAGAQAGAVRVLDEPSGEMVLVSQRGLPGPVLDFERRVGSDCGVCGAALEGEALVYSQDVGACHERHGGDYFGSDCQRLMAVPLRHRGRALGVYNLFYDQSHQPPAEAAELLRPIGELLGLALDHARVERETLRSTLMDERQTMAADMHDSVAQSLAYIKMRMPLLHDAMLQHDDTRALQYYEDVRRTLSEAHTSLRELLTEFRTRIDPLGLMHALQGVAADYPARTGIALAFDNQLSRLVLAPHREAQAFHIVQEALANIARHSSARHAWLRVGRQGATVHIRIEDDGAGLPTVPVPDSLPERARHHGIEIMKTRARRLGGTLAMGPREGGGTCVHLSIPLEAPDTVSPA